MLGEARSQLGLTTGRLLVSSAVSGRASPLLPSTASSNGAP